MTTGRRHVSMGEIEFVVTRAAFGVGAPFGIAEDFALPGERPSCMAEASLEQLQALASGAIECFAGVTRGEPRDAL